MYPLYVSMLTPVSPNELEEEALNTTVFCWV